MQLILYAITENKYLSHIESVQQEILWYREAVTSDTVKRTYAALCTQNSQEPSKALTVTISGKRETHLEA